MIHVLCFSPTGGTRRAAAALVAGLGDEARWHDISPGGFRAQDVPVEVGDTCVLALPCFAGLAPKFAMPRVAALPGEGAEAILLATFGNRAIEDMLLEMEQGMLRAGFYVRGAVVAATQHTFCPQIGAGRPNTDDRREIEHFGEILAAQKDRIDSPLALPGNVPWREIAPAHFHPVVEDKCNRCGACVPACPVAAIPAGAPDQTDANVCMGCMQYVRVCPQHARQMSEQDRVAACRMLTRIGAAGPNKPNRLYIRET